MLALDTTNDKDTQTILRHTKLVEPARKRFSDVTVDHSGTHSTDEIRILEVLDLWHINRERDYISNNFLYTDKERDESNTNQQDCPLTKSQRFFMIPLRHSGHLNLAIVDLPEHVVHIYDPLCGVHYARSEAR